MAVALTGFATLPVPRAVHEDEEEDEVEALLAAVFVVVAVVLRVPRCMALEVDAEDVDTCVEVTVTGFACGAFAVS